MMNSMASRMMADFGNFGNFGSSGQGRGRSNMMSLLDDDEPFGSFGGVFGRDFMDMESAFKNMMEKRNNALEGDSMEGSG